MVKKSRQRESHGEPVAAESASVQQRPGRLYSPRSGSRCGHKLGGRCRRML